MITETKLKILSIVTKITDVNKELLELATTVAEADGIELLAASKHLIDATNKLMKAAK